MCFRAASSVCSCQNTQKVSCFRSQRNKILELTQPFLIYTPFICLFFSWAKALTKYEFCQGCGKKQIQPIHLEFQDLLAFSSLSSRPVTDERSFQEPILVGFFFVLFVILPEGLVVQPGKNQKYFKKRKSNVEFQSSFLFHILF